MSKNRVIKSFNETENGPAADEPPSSCESGSPKEISKTNVKGCPESVQDETSAGKNRERRDPASEPALKAKDKPPKNEKAQEKNKKKKSKKFPWALKSLIITLFLSFGFGILSELIVAGLTLKNIFIAYILILIIVMISIVSDVIGVAATSCDMQPFLAMAARKVKGSKMAVRIAKNRDVVNSVCSDIIGDICGIISGACGAAIITVMALSNNTVNLIASVACSTVIAALMITGKAMGKKLGLKKSNQVVMGVAKVLSVFGKN